METIDVIIELLETGKNLNQFGSNAGKQVTGGDSTEEIIQTINNMVGYDRTATMYCYFNGEINMKNAILRLVTDEPKLPMTSSLPKEVSFPELPNKRRSLVSNQRKRGRKKVYNQSACIEALQRASQHLGNYFTRKAYKEFVKGRRDYPSEFTINRYLHTDTKESWNKALANIGLNRKELKAAK